MGEVSQVVFVSEILAQIRGRGIDLDRLGQRKSLQDGLTVDKKEAIQHLTKLLVDQMQKWLPVVQADSGSQRQIAALQAEIAELKAKAVSAPQQEAQAPEGSPPPPPPIEAAFEGNRPVAFDPAQLLVTPGGTNQWLENNMPESFSDSKYKAWYKALKLRLGKPSNVTLWQWRIGGEINLKRQNLLFTELLFALEYPPARSSPARMRTF